ncbi:MAG: MFS transporter [Chloroflexota bacterium]
MPTEREPALSDQDDRIGLPSPLRIVIFSSIAGTMTVFGQTAGVSVFIDHLIRDLAISRPAISTIYSISSLTAALAMSWVGSRIDTVGIRRSTLVVSAAFGTAVFALAGVWEIVGLAIGFFAIRLLGQGALSLLSKVVVVLRFRQGLGRAVGISGAAAALGFSILPIPISALIDQVGWRSTLAIGGISIWVVMIPLTVWAMDRTRDRAMSGKDRDHHAAAAGATRSEAIRTGMFWVISLTVATVSLVVTALTFHQISILGETGLSPTQAAAVFFPQTVASTLALLSVGLLADRIPGRLMVGASMALLTVATLLIQVLDVGPVPLFYAITLGAAMGTAFAAEGVLYPRYFGVREIGAIRGLAFTISVGAAALGPIIVGVARGATNDYPLAGLALLWMPIVVGLAVLVVRTPTMAARR